MGLAPIERQSEDRAVRPNSVPEAQYDPKAIGTSLSSSFHP